MIELARRRMMMGGSVLPYDAEVKCLESSGTQYIDTDATWYGDGYEIQIDFAPLNYTGGQCPFGTQDNTTVLALYYSDNSNGNIFIYGGSGSTDNRRKQNMWMPNVRNNITMQLDNDVATVTVNSVVTTYSAQTDCVNVIPTISLFATHHPDGYNIPASMKLYSFRLIKQGSLIRDMIPVRKGNTGYLYDKVSGQLFGNQGTGQFIIGPDK